MFLISSVGLPSPCVTAGSASPGDIPCRAKPGVAAECGSPFPSLISYLSTPAFPPSATTHHSSWTPKEIASPPSPFLLFYLGFRRPFSFFFSTFCSRLASFCFLAYRYPPFLFLSRAFARPYLFPLFGRECQPTYWSPELGQRVVPPLRWCHTATQQNNALAGSRFPFNQSSAKGYQIPGIYLLCCCSFLLFVTEYQLSWEIIGVRMCIRPVGRE